MSDLHDLLGSEDEEEQKLTASESGNKADGSDKVEENHEVTHPISDDSDKNKSADLDDLLGAADDEEKSEDNHNGDSEHVQTNSKPMQVEAKSSVLDDLLGESDEEDAMEVDNNTNIPQSSELDKIFGEVPDDSEQNRSKMKIKSHLQLPAAYKFSSSSKTIFLRTPNFVKIQSSPYEDTNFQGEEERKQFDGASSVIRHRLSKDGTAVESNARLLHWSDGSYQLVVGDAIFEMKVVPTENCYVYQQQITTEQMEDGPEIEKFHLECNGPIDSRIILQPNSLDSEIHTRMTLKISEKNRREKKISIRDHETILENPEKTLQRLIKQEEEENRKLRKLREQNSEARTFMINTSRRGPAMNAAYLNDDYDEDEEEEEAQEEVVEKSKSAKGRRNQRYDEEEEDEDDRGANFSPEGSDEGESLGSRDTNEEEEAEEDEEDEDNDFIVNDEDEEEEEESEESGESSDEDRPAKKKKEKDEKGEKVKAKRKEKKEKKQKKKDKKAKKEKQKRKREAEEGSNEESSSPVRKSTPQDLGEDDEEEDLNVPLRKKTKRAFMDSDEED